MLNVFSVTADGHTQYTCPATTQSKPSLLCSAPRSMYPSPVPEPARMVPILVNGQREMSLLDTGSFKSVALSSLMPRDVWSDAKEKISCNHGEEKEYPVVDMYLTVRGQTFLLPVALAPRLHWAVVLGLDVPTLTDLVSSTDANSLTFSNSHEDIQLRTQEAAQVQNLSPMSTVEEPLSICSLVTTRAQTARNPLQEIPFYDVELELGPVKPAKSRAQRRNDKFLASVTEETEVKMTPCPLLDFAIPSEIALQRSDLTLKPWFDKVIQDEGKVHLRIDHFAD